jgi:hypothetical protein
VALHRDAKDAIKSQPDAPASALLLYESCSRSEIRGTHHLAAISTENCRCHRPEFSALFRFGSRFRRFKSRVGCYGCLPDMLQGRPASL